MIIKLKNKKKSNLHRFFAFEAKYDEEKEDKKKYTVVKAEGDSEATDYTDDEDTEEPDEDDEGEEQQEEDVPENNEATDYTDDENNIEEPQDENNEGEADNSQEENDNGNSDGEEADNGETDDNGEAEATDYTNNGESEADQENQDGDEEQQEVEPEEQNPEAEADSYRKYDLFKDFINLKNTVNSYISTLSEMVGDNIEANMVITTIVNNFKDLVKMIHDFMLVKYDDTSYFQAMTFYKSCTTMIELNFDLLKNNKPYLKQ